MFNEIIKKIKLYTVVVLLITIPNTSSYAGFRSKKSASETETASTPTDKRSSPAAGTKKEKRIATVHMVKRLLAFRKYGPGPHSKDNGWQGIASFACGVAILLSFALPYLLFLSVPAIIFGAMGVGKKHTNRGLALAGLILGALTVLFVALLIVALAVAFG